MEGHRVEMHNDSVNTVNVGSYQFKGSDCDERRHKCQCYTQNSRCVFQMEHFFKLHSEAGAGEMPRQQALETVHNNIRWLNNNLDEIATWLTAKVPAAV